MNDPDQPRFRQTLRTGEQPKMGSPFLPVAEDLEWLRSDWLMSKALPPNAVLRRGSGTLRQLLCHGLIHRAWRHHGLEGHPTVIGPDLLALLEHHNIELRHAVTMVAGGACVDGVQFIATGLCRTDNPTTGVSADAEEGFAVATSTIARDARGEAEKNELTPMVEREWRIGQYLDAPGAIRRGQKISRRLIIDFFANYAGGVHLDRAVGQANAERRALYELVAELEERVAVDKVEGLYFELLAIGQALGQSDSLQRLVEAIHRNDHPNSAADEIKAAP